MQKIAFALLAVVASLPLSAKASPLAGQITRPDPLLLQSYWSSLSVRDGLRERDEVRIEHAGQVVAEGLVVSVTADHSVIMLKGVQPATPQSGDAVVLVKQAAALPAPATVAAALPSGYKVVGGHSLFSINVTPVNITPFNSDTSLSSSPFSISGFSIGTPTFSSDIQITNQLGSSASFSSSFTAGSDFSIGGFNASSNLGF